MSFLTEKAPALLALGYECVPIKPGLKHPGVKGWSQIQYTRDKLRLAAINGHAGGGVGIKTRHTPAVDIDVYDPAMAEEIRAFVVDLLGEAPMRVGEAPKCALVYRTEEPFSKVNSASWEDPGDWEHGYEHKVEILGDGQQLVAYHVHPGTGRPYTWSDELDGVKVDELPVITLEQARSIANKFDKLAEARGWQRVTKGAEGTETGGEADDFDNHAKPLDLTTEEITEALDAVDPEGLDYDDWLSVGMALYHESRGVGLDQWIAWSERSSKHVEKTCRVKWRSFEAKTYRGKPITFATVLHMAKEAKGEAVRAKASNVVSISKGAPAAPAAANYKLKGDDPEGNAATILGMKQYVRYKKQAYQWTGCYWESLTDEEFEASVRVGFCMGQNLKPSAIKNTFDVVRVMAVRKRFTPDPARLAFQNGTLNLAGWDRGACTPQLETHDPDHHITSLLPFDYDPTAQCPRWLQFLNEVLPEQSFQNLLREYIGYCLVWDYRHQKMLLLQGASRSGKGTIARVIQQLNRGAFAGVSLSSMAGDRGLVTLANAKVAVIGDAHRVEKAKIERAKEALLTVTGQDSVHLDPKYKDAYSATIPARLVLLANEMPRFFDKYDALSNRYLVLPFTKSFAGREDVSLGDALEAELPGIFNWALGGLLELGQRGRFIDSPELKAIRTTAAERNNPVGGFMARYVRREPGAELFVDDAYEAYRQFCTAFDHPTASETAFGTALRDHLEGCEKGRATVNGRKRTVYRGVCLDAGEVRKAIGFSDEGDSWED